MDGRPENRLSTDDPNVLENWSSKIYDDHLGSNHV